MGHVIYKIQNLYVDKKVNVLKDILNLMLKKHKLQKMVIHYIKEKNKKMVVKLFKIKTN